MKSLKKLLPIAVIAMMATNANAAFVVKQQPAQATEVVSATQQTANTLTQTNEVSTIENAQALESQQAAKSTDGISKGIYILLALLGLGWLGMGLNDDFGGSDWVISLVLYLLFFLPGFIYTLIKMKKYYK
jgi:uncharacterized membrane protein YqaE (UPF0057 family)